MWLSERLVPPFEAACPLSAFSVPRSVLSPPESRLARGVGSVGILRSGRARYTGRVSGRSNGEEPGRGHAVTTCEQGSDSRSDGAPPLSSI